MPREPLFKRPGVQRFMRMISGWRRGIASLLIVGGKNFPVYPVSQAEDGYHDDWIPNTWWVNKFLDVKMEESNGLARRKIELLEQVLAELRLLNARGDEQMPVGVTSDEFLEEIASEDHR